MFFVEFAVLADDDDVTYFRQRQIQMYAAYHNMIDPIVEFVPIGQLVAARVRDGGLLIVAPVDLLVWTGQLGSFVTDATDLIRLNYGPPSKQIWLSGRATDLAKASLAGLGWKVEEGARFQGALRADEGSAVANRALELIGKHRNMFGDQSLVTVTNDIPHGERQLDGDLLAGLLTKAEKDDEAP